jgi:hypothetical protein
MIKISFDSPIMDDAQAQLCIYFELLTPRRVRRRMSIFLCYSNRTVGSEIHRATILIAHVAEATNLFNMC